MVNNITKFVFLIFSFAGICLGQAIVPERTSDGASNPISYGIVVDNSGSLRMRLERVIKLVDQIVAANASDDEAFLVTFVDSEKIVVRQEMTTEQDLLKDAADNMFIEGGKTAILDALSLSHGYLQENSAGAERLKRLILITDGDERSSRAKLPDLLIKLKEAKISVFVVGISDLKLETKLIERLAKETGGKAYFPVTTAELEAAAGSIARDLRKPN